MAEDAYRVAQLGDEPIYRPEWLKRGWLGVSWCPFYGLFGETFEYKSREDAERFLVNYQERERLEGLRKKGMWRNAYAEPPQ